MALRLPRKLVVKVRILAVAFAAVAMVGMSAAPAEAQQQRRLQFIRDAEIEHIIRTYAEPIFEVSGINGDSVEIALVKDSSLNAFVAGGMNLFIHTGLLQESESPGELIGVVAHEIGHIAGGHLIRSQEDMDPVLDDVMRHHHGRVDRASIEHVVRKRTAARSILTFRAEVAAGQLRQVLEMAQALVAAGRVGVVV